MRFPLLSKENQIKHPDDKGKKCGWAYWISLTKADKWRSEYPDIKSSNSPLDKVVLRYGDFVNPLRCHPMMVLLTVNHCSDYKDMFSEKAFYACNSDLRYLKNGHFQWKPRYRFTQDDHRFMISKHTQAKTHWICAHTYVSESKCPEVMASLLILDIGIRGSIISFSLLSSAF